MTQYVAPNSLAGTRQILTLSVAIYEAQCAVEADNNTQLDTPDVVRADRKPKVSDETNARGDTACLLQDVLIDSSLKTRPRKMRRTIISIHDLPPFSLNSKDTKRLSPGSRYSPFSEHSKEKNMCSVLRIGLLVFLLAAFTTSLIVLIILKI